MVGRDLTGACSDCSVRNSLSGTQWSNCTGRRHGKPNDIPGVAGGYRQVTRVDGPLKALADRNGLATPATVNQFSVAARQWQLKVATRTPSGLHHCCC